MKHFTDQEIEQAIKRSPKLIQNEIMTGEDTAVIIAGLGKTRGLHIDQIGTLAELNRNMLLGLISPDEFLKDLIEAKIPEKDARDIMKEINEKIFVPLREEMRKGLPTEVKHAEVKPPQAQSVAPQEPRESILQPRTTMIPANPNLPQRPAEASGVGGSRPTQTPSITPKYVPPKKYFHLQNNKIPTTPPQPSPQLRQGYDGHSKAGDVSLTYVNPAKLLEDHEEPHLDISEKVQVASPPTIQRKVYEPPPNLPGAIYHPPIPKPSNLPPTPSSKPYSSDPYREPIGE